MREITIMGIIIFIIIVLSFFSPHFLTSDNIASIAVSLAADGIITVGMTIVLVLGGVDFSSGAVMACSGVIVADLYLNGFNIWIAVIISLIVALIIGFINGFFIGKVGLNPFITTIAVMGITKGASFVFIKGSLLSIDDPPKSFTALGQGDFFGIPVIVFIFLIIAIVGDFLMRRSEILRKVFYVGSNEKAAILSGIDSSKIKINVYILSAFLASVAGILTLARFTVATPTIGLGADVSMRSISAAVIGGTSLSGGEGSVFGAILGLILINLINNGLILLNVPLYWQDMLNGLILLLVVTLDFISHKNSTMKFFNNKEKKIDL